jgi:hypothetical protein
MKFQGHGHSAMISMLFDMNTHFWFQVIRNDMPSVRSGPVLARTRAEFHQVGAYPQFLINSLNEVSAFTHTFKRWTRKDARPDAYNRRTFRFCAVWLKRVMHIAEAALLPPIKSFGPSEFLVLDISGRPHSMRGGVPPGHSGGGVGLPQAVATARCLERR